MTAQKLGCCRTTLDKYIQRYPALQDFFESKRLEHLDDAEDTLYKAAKRGNLSAAMFILKTQGRDRGWVEARPLEARSVVWKYLDDVIEAMDTMYPWMRGYFVKETRRYYAKPYKDSWYVLPKTASKSKPENLAGQHNINLMIVADEASGIDDAIHGVLRGALTHERNRYVMTSQPTRPAGHFAEAMTKLALEEGKKDGIYTAITMNSEESPIVSKKFITEKLMEYGGHHSPEYQIKVLGRLPDNLSGYLIPRQWCVQCQSLQVIHQEAPGYVPCIHC